MKKDHQSTPEAPNPTRRRRSSQVKPVVFSDHYDKLKAERLIDELKSHSDFGHLHDWSTETLLGYFEDAQYTWWRAQKDAEKNDANSIAAEIYSLADYLQDLSPEAEAALIRRADAKEEPLPFVVLYGSWRDELIQHARTVAHAYENDPQQYTTGPRLRSVGSVTYPHTRKGIRDRAIRHMIRILAFPIDPNWREPDKKKKDWLIRRYLNKKDGREFMSGTQGARFIRDAIQLFTGTAPSFETIEKALEEGWSKRIGARQGVG